MKKTLSILSMMLLGCALYAGPVTPEKALQVAQRVFASASATKATDASSLKIVWNGEFEPATKAAQDPDFYVVSRSGGGFVMVAGNDNVQPVLAFSFENDFPVEGMPDHVRSWMQQYKDYIRSVASATPEVQEQWESFEETKANTAKPYEGVTDEFLLSRTNLWNQTNPANFYCPDVTGQTQTSVCGCVALAVAEIMAWFGTQNSSSFEGTVPEYSYKSDNEITVTVPEHNLYSGGYKWDEIKKLAATDPFDFYRQVDGFDSATTNEEAYGFLFYGANKNNPVTKAYNTLSDLGEEIGHLAYDIGTLLKAEYNSSENGFYGTGAITAYIPERVAPVMGYNKNARFLSKDDYPGGQWEIMMKEEVSKRPVLYNGSGNGGHAYVADGYATYQGKLCFHFNMGWGGSYNGYYNLIIQDEFYTNHCAIFDFYPSAESVALPQMGYIRFKNTVGGMEYLSGYNTETLSFKLLNFFNIGSGPFTGDMYFVLESVTGEHRSSMVFLNRSTPLPATSGWGWTNPENGPYNVNVSTAVLGDRIVAYYESGKEEMLPFAYDLYTSGLTALPVFPAAAIQKASSYHVNDTFVFAITNNSYRHLYSSWKVTAPDGSYEVYDLDDYYCPLTSAGEYKIEATIYDPSNSEVELEKLVTYITVE
jgi:hypothetical protein